MKPELIQTQDLRWIGIDLDQTIAATEPPKFELGEPLPGAVEYINKMWEDGYKPIIYTARGWDEYNVIEWWLDNHNIPYRRIICGKPLFKWIIDDKNIEFKGDWETAYSKIV